MKVPDRRRHGHAIARHGDSPFKALSLEGVPLGVPRRVPQEPKPRLIDRQNRVALPQDVLKALDVQSGDHVAFDVDGDRVSIHKVRWVIDKK